MRMYNLTELIGVDATKARGSGCVHSIKRTQLHVKKSFHVVAGDHEVDQHWRHYLQCPQGLLGKHFEKLIKCDPHLNFLSQQAEVELESPYFEPMTSVFDEPNETNEYDLSREARPGILDLHRTTSPYSSSRSELHDPMVD
ncbi:hypothetical protein Tco_1234625 [Tanacetum coccineum]